jgi:hypothetical protein
LLSYSPWAFACQKSSTACAMGVQSVVNTYPGRVNWVPLTPASTREAPYF